MTQLHISNGSSSNGVDRLAVNPAGTRLYVAGSGFTIGGPPPHGYRFLSVFDIGTLTEIAQLSVFGDGTGYLETSADGTRAYWTGTLFSSEVDVIDTSTNTKLNRLGSGFLYGLTTLPDGRIVVATDDFGSPPNPRLQVFAQDETLLTTVAIPGSIGGVYGASPDGQHLYVAGDGVMIDVDPASYSVRGTIPAVGSIAFAQGRMYVHGSQSITVVDVATRAIVGSVPVVTGSEMVTSPDDSGLFLFDGHVLKRLDASTNIVTTVATVEGVSALAAVAALTFDRNPIKSAAVTGGPATAKTDVHWVTIGVPKGVAWTAASDQPFVVVDPASGTGSGIIAVGTVPDASLPSSGDVSAKIVVTAAGIGNSPQALDVSLRMFPPASTAPPIGFFDTPIDNSSGLTGAILVSGWALDDVGISAVRLCRDPVAGDPAPNCYGVDGKIAIGYAPFVAGTRPDVEAIFSDYPMAYRGSWGYRLLTNMLPDLVAGTPAGGRGTFTLYAYAEDVERIGLPFEQWPGHTTLLGPRTFTCDNTTATKPFGTIDTPVPGETVSGMFHNFGWVLTPQPGVMPTDGSTIVLYIDGVARGTAQYNLPRSDIQQLFPGYANTSGAIGHFAIDTTTLTNGLHTIYWIATDNLGRADGIGSRYFTVLN